MESESNSRRCSPIPLKSGCCATRARSSSDAGLKAVTSGGLACSSGFIIMFCNHSRTGLCGNGFEARAVVRFEPVERRAFFRFQSQLGAVLNKVGALFRVFEHTVGLHFIRPGLN